MKRTAAALLMLAVAAGCSHASIDASTRLSSANVGVHVHSHSLAAVILSGMFMAAAIDHAREPQSSPSFSTFADWFRGTPAPELASDRRVVEHDCAKPLPELSGNLKCR